MSAFAEVISWFCVALVQLGLIGAAVGCYMMRVNGTEAYTKEKETMKNNAEELKEFEKNYKTS